LFDIFPFIFFFWGECSYLNYRMEFGKNVEDLTEFLHVQIPME
jgi:hypothetical protein